MRLKSWPFWETRKLIFGKDRAQRNTARDITDAAARARPQESLEVNAMKMITTLV